MSQSIDKTIKLWTLFMHPTRFYILKKIVWQSLFEQILPHIRNGITKNGPQNQHACNSPLNRMSPICSWTSIAVITEIPAALQLLGLIYTVNRALQIFYQLEYYSENHKNDITKHHKAHCRTICVNKPQWNFPRNNDDDKKYIKTRDVSCYQNHTIILCSPYKNSGLYCQNRIFFKIKWYCKISLRSAQ